MLIMSFQMVPFTPSVTKYPMRVSLSPLAYSAVFVAYERELR